MKNKSYDYIFPIIFYRMLQKGCSGNLMYYIDNTYLSDKKGRFVITLNNKSYINNSEISEEILDSLFDCTDIIDNIEFKENKIILFINISDDIKEAINAFVLGAYSKIPEKFKKEILDFTFKYIGGDEIHVYERIGGVLYQYDSLRKQIMKELELSENELPKGSELDSRVKINAETYG